MKPTSALAKGKLLEDWIVDQLRSSGLDQRAYRQRGSGSGKNKGDIWNDLNLCFEAKNTARLQLGSFFTQAEREALGTQVPVVVWHPPHKPLEDSLVAIPWSFFKELLLKVRNSTPAYQNPDRAANFALNSLKLAISRVQKELNL